MTLTRAGFTLADIEKLFSEYDAEFTNGLISEASKRESIEFIKYKAGTAEAVLWGTAAMQSKKNHSGYTQWQKRNLSAIEKLRGFKRRSVWDQIKRSAKF